MMLNGNRVLITGGATGLGLAIATEFNNRGSTVAVCGRRQARLDEAKKRLPWLKTFQCDISKEEGRRGLEEWAGATLGYVNVLVNNAGIQRPMDFRKGMEDLLKNEDEIEINLRSQIYMAARFIPALAKQERPAIINVSSGLGFAPLAMFPVYCATKAAIHSFTLSLRHQLRDTGIKVFEVIPPTLYDTELKGRPIPKTDYSISAAEMAAEVMKGIEMDRYEIAAGQSVGMVSATRGELDTLFRNMNH